MYGGTKHYVLGFSNAIADELRGSGVSVTCFCPTATKTLFWKRANAEDCKVLRRGALVMDAATAARHGYKALARGKTTAAPGLLTSFVMFSGRLMPRKVATRMFGQLLEPA